MKKIEKIFLFCMYSIQFIVLGLIISTAMTCLFEDKNQALTASFIVGFIVGIFLGKDFYKKIFDK